MTFDQALTALLLLMGRRIEVQVFDQGGDVPAEVAIFSGVLTEACRR